jgi:nucleotide-binding universal stress UspA family protein
MSWVRRIVHASDFSPASRAAFSRAVELARANRAELTVLHVMTPIIPYVGDAYATPQAYEAMLASVRTQAQRQLDRLVRRARSGGARVRGVLVEGVPHERIARAARARRADLIVVGTHGRTGVARFFVGSVAARVIAIAPCPVLTVRGRSRRGTP